MNVPQRRKLMFKQIRLSPATLDLMSLAHRTLAIQTSQLEGAAADLFRRCERLREELGNAVKQMSELSNRVQCLDDEKEDGGHGSRNFDSRLESAKERQKGLAERHEVLRRKVARAGMAGKDLSAKEISWAQEITGLAKMVGVETEEASGGDEDEQSIANNVWNDRYASVSHDVVSPFHAQNSYLQHQVKQLAKELLVQAQAVQKEQPGSDTQPQTNGHARSGSNASPRSTLGVPSKLQRAKIMDAMAMVERESAVIEAVMARLDRLNLEIQHTRLGGCMEENE